MDSESEKKRSVETLLLVDGSNLLPPLLPQVEPRTFFVLSTVRQSLSRCRRADNLHWDDRMPAKSKC